MSNKEIKVGLKIEAKSEIGELQKTINQLKLAGEDVHELEEATSKLSDSMSELGKKQQLIDSFKSLKSESKLAADNIEIAQKKVNDLASAGKKSGKAFKDATADVKRWRTHQASLAQQTQKTRKALSDMGISTKNLSAEQKKLTTKTKLVELGYTSLARKMKQVRQEIDQTSTSSKQMGDGFEKSSKGLGGISTKSLGATAAITGLVYVAKEVVQTFSDIDKKFDRMEKTFTEITGSQEVAAVEMDRMIDVANRLGLSFSEVSEGYTGFLASAKGANYTFEESSALFEQTAQKVLAMGKSTEDVNGVLLAFSQILSKGVVSTEELNQIAERLPGTFDSAAKSMGMTTGEMRDLIAEGKVAANDFLPKFVAELKSSAQVQETNVQTAAKLKNEWELLVNTLDKSIGVSDGVQESMGALSKTLRLIRAESEGDIDLIPDNFFDDVAKGFPVLNTFKKLLNATGDAIGKETDRLINRSNANEKARKATDELTAAYIKLNEARQAGNADAVAKAEESLANALNKTNEAYADSNVESVKHKEKLAELKTTIDELNPQYRELRLKMQRLDDAGYGNSQMYADTAVEADKLKVKLDSLKATQSTLEGVKVGVRPEDIAEQQKSVDALLGSIAELKKSIEDAEKAQAGINTETEAGRQAYEAQQGVIDKLNVTLNEQKDALAKIAPLVNQVADSSQKEFLTLEQKADKYNEVTKKIEHFAEMMKLTGDEGGRFSKVLETLKTEQHELREELEKYSLSGQDVLETYKKQSDALKTLGVDLDQLSTGMSATERQVIDALSPALDGVRERFKGVGDETSRTATAIESVLVQALGKIQSPAGLEAFKAKLAEANLSAEQHANVLEAVNAKANELNDTYQSLGDAIAKATSQQALDAQMNALRQSLSAGKITTEQFAEATQQLVAKRGELIRAESDVAKSTNNTSDKTKEAIRTTQAHAEALVQTAQATQSVADSNKNAELSITLLNNEAEKSPYLLNQVKEGLAGMDSETNARARIDAWNRLFNAVQYTSAEYNEHIKVVDALMAKIRSGEASMTDFQQATMFASQGVDYLDAQRLDQLKATIADARAEMDALAESAKNAADAREKELLRLQGKGDEADRLDYLDKIAEIERQIDEARARGNLEAIRQLERQLELERQIYEEKQKKDKQDASPSGSSSSSAASGSSSLAPVVINIGNKPIQTELPAKVASQLGAKMGEFVHKLQHEVSKQVVSETAKAVDDTFKKMADIRHNTVGIYK